MLRSDFASPHESRLWARRIGSPELPLRMPSNWTVTKLLQAAMTQCMQSGPTMGAWEAQAISLTYKKSAPSMIAPKD